MAHSVSTDGPYRGRGTRSGRPGPPCALCKRAGIDHTARHLNGFRPRVRSIRPARAAEGYGLEHEPLAQSLGGGLGTVLGPHLPQDPLDVLAHRGLTDRQRLSDRLVRSTGHKEL